MTENSESLLTPLQREYLARYPEASVVEQPTELAERAVSGVGGWLLLLTVSLLAFGPLWNAIRVQSSAIHLAMDMLRDARWLMMVLTRPVRCR